MSDRKIDARLQQIWDSNIEKENRLRLLWFKKNEKALIADCDRPLQRAVGKELLAESEESRKQLIGSSVKFPKKAFGEPEPPLVDPDAFIHVMKPIDHDVKRILYTSTNKDGRVRYLGERVKIAPDQKYYFPETTSFNYGWKMWNHAKTNTDPRYGKSQIIKQSFYRRRGVTGDPPWYQEPMRSPTVCDCI